MVLRQIVTADWFTSWEPLGDTTEAEGEALLDLLRPPAAGRLKTAIIATVRDNTATKLSLANIPRVSDLKVFGLRSASIRRVTSRTARIQPCDNVNRNLRT